MNKSNLDRIIEEVTARSLVGSVSIAIEKMAEEIAKETLSDEEFRESLHCSGACRVQKNIGQARRRTVRKYQHPMKLVRGNYEGASELAQFDAGPVEKYFRDSLNSSACLRSSSSVYVCSPKFFCGDKLDGYVNCNDIARRLTEAQSMEVI